MPAPGGYADAVRKSSAAVVNLYSERAVTDEKSGVQRLLLSSLGSGVIIDDAGYLVTNNHLIRGATRVRVQLADGRLDTPVLVGIDPETDLALLRTRLTDLPGIAMGRSDQLEIGDVVLAIGNPYGLSQTVTQGIVSATGRGLLGLTSFENFIQTDAAINQGNSGGALINTNGELVGINTATLSQNTEGAGIGFAIPVNLVRGVAEDLKQHGRVIRGWLGVVPHLKQLTRGQLLEYGIDAHGGIVVDNVYPNGPGALAGVQRFDILTHLNQMPIENRQQALLLVAGLEPGAVVEIDGYRGKTPISLRAVAGERPVIPE